jgi:hypothetical protein
MARAGTKLKPKRKKLTQKEQSERFRETARDLGCDESEDALKRAFEKIIEPKPIACLKNGTKK